MKKIHYAWVVCVLGMLLIFITMGVVSNGFSVFLPYIMKEYGLTGAQTSSLITLRCIVSFIAMLLIGFYYKKVSIRVGTTIAAACAGIAFFIYAFADGYRMFCIGAAITGLTYGLGSMIPMSILMGKWFVKRRAFAVGVCSAGSGVATMVLPEVSTLLVEHFSLSKAFLIEAVFVFIMASVNFIFLRNEPAEKGLKPYGYIEKKEEEKARVLKHSGYTLSLKEWILIGCVSLSMGALANPGFSHMSVLFTSEGFNAMIVATIMSATGICMTVGKLGFGQVSDRIGGRKSSLLFAAVFLIGNLLCCFAFLRSTAVSVLTILFMGFGFAIATIGPSVWAGDLAEPADYAKVVRRLQVIYAGGALAFANVPGFTYDIFGSYIPAYIIFAAITGISLLLIFLAYRENDKRRAAFVSREVQ